MSSAILDSHPTQIELSGPELLEVSGELRRRGCVILSAVVVCVSHYRLALAWPRPEQQPLIETDFQNGA